MTRIDQKLIKAASFSLETLWKLQEHFVARPGMKHEVGAACSPLITQVCKIRGECCNLRGEA